MMTSGFSVEASASMEYSFAGRRFAYRPNRSRSPSSARSGRTS